MIFLVVKLQNSFFTPLKMPIIVILIFSPCRVSVYSKLFFFFHVIDWFSMFTLEDFSGCLITLGCRQPSWELLVNVWGLLTGSYTPGGHGEPLMSQCLSSWLTHIPTEIT